MNNLGIPFLAFFFIFGPWNSPNTYVLTQRSLGDWVSVQSCMLAPATAQTTNFISFTIFIRPTQSGIERLKGGHWMRGPVTFTCKCQANVFLWQGPWYINTTWYIVRIQTLHHLYTHTLTNPNTHRHTHPHLHTHTYKLTLYHW